MNDTQGKEQRYEQLAGRLIATVYDYTHQAWTVDGRYVRCGHPEAMDCQCYGKLHEGEQAN